MTAAKPQFDRQAKAAFIVACLVLLVSGLGFEWAVQAWNVYLRKLPVDMRGTFDTIPKTLGRWERTGDDRVLDSAVIEELGTRKYLDRTYAIDGSTETLNVHLAYYTGMIDAVPHVPDRCFVAGGFNLKSLPTNFKLEIDQEHWQVDPEFVNLQSKQPYWIADVADGYTGNFRRVRMPVGELWLRTSEFERPEYPNLRIYAGYFFIANGRIAVAPGDVKQIAFDHTERYAYYCKVQFTYAATDATPERFAELVSDLLKDLLPQLMDRLPDWAEVERRQEAPAEVQGPASS